MPEPGIGVDSGARVLTVAETRTAVYLPVPQPRVEVVDETGTIVSSTLLPRPPSSPNVVTRPGNLITWWTGDTVMVFDAANLTYRYSIAPCRPVRPGGAGDDDGRQVARPGHVGRNRRLRSSDRSG